MEELELKRRNGYLDLSEYFIRKLGREYQDLEELYAKGFIDFESSGRSNKFWVLEPDTGRKVALFKEEAYHSDEAYAELLSEEVAKLLGIDVAHYDLATFDGKKGVLSANFRNEYDRYYSGADLLLDFYGERIENDDEMSELYNISDEDKDSIEGIADKLNNLEDIWAIVEDQYKGNPHKQMIVEYIMNGLVNKIIFDILMVNVDDHGDNWGLLNHFLAPLFDNERVLNLHHNILTEKDISGEKIENKELRLTVDDSGINKPLEVLDQFLKISSSEYHDLVIDKVTKLKDNLYTIPHIIENRTKVPMPEYVKNHFLNTMSGHLEKVDAVIESNAKWRKK